MKAITVRQPWAWAIIHGRKTVENRTTRWQYRGPLAIHAARADDPREDAWRYVDRLCPEFPNADLIRGALIGTVEMVDVHDGYHCVKCGPWGFTRVAPSGYGWTHLVLENPVPLAAPVECIGRLGLWNVSADIGVLT